ncbi:purine-nucleoside phosphorylase [Sulfuriroseicoccus oceanibius]|uniref:Purine nucleoside phosphorylase n=1 Tax=Sulfuriroseicoccus oceanibius TaxID=2707525 RepID=A0A6B3L9J5_9BACT|nr:purine-nucleoside phosphorylase [Sulfuriroseicoccus oceanibius]QQL44178.1 purine-nucleoside phosphorylase [Sulfuriroseicoccus oceanibius]
MVGAGSDQFDDGVLSELRAFRPELGVVLGSGFGGLVSSVREVGACSFSDAELPVSSVPGHVGRLVWGCFAGLRVVMACGRVHLYEGWAARDVTATVRLFAAAGVGSLLLTNAAGRISPRLSVGGLMVLSDHLNLTSVSPLDGAAGFIDMTNAYCPQWRGELLDAAASCGVGVGEGVYACVRGPQYETPAEVRMLGALGADAVGMSTVLEVIEARARGLRVAGVSCLTNVAAGLDGANLDHDEVVAIAGGAGGGLVAVLECWSARRKSG